MELKIGDKVTIVIGRASGLGVMVLVNELQEGLIYRNEIFHTLKEGDKMEGYVKKIREDGKLDISLQPQGFLNTIEYNCQKIIEKLKENNGFLGLTDKSKPGFIARDLQMSKKSFKSAIGVLYKQKKILIKEDGILLIN